MACVGIGASAGAAAAVYSLSADRDGRLATATTLRMSTDLSLSFSLHFSLRHCWLLGGGCDWSLQIQTPWHDEHQRLSDATACGGPGNRRRLSVGWTGLPNG